MKRTQVIMDVSIFFITVIVVILIVVLVQRYAAATSKLSIPPRKAQEKVKSGANFIDVREPSEWDQGHAAGSRLIPQREFREKAAGFPKNKPIVVICASGSRSVSMVKMLKKMGFQEAWSVRGGINSWKHLGLPMAGVKKTKDPWR